MSSKLDRLVAERVMGESKPPHPGNEWCHYRSAPLYSEGKQWVMSTASPDHNGSTVWGGWIPMPYSSKISAAWEVVEKMRSKRLHLIINDTMGEYRARFFDSHWSIDQWVRSPDSPMTAWAATAPIAICLAALRACGVPKSEIQEAMNEA